MSTTTILATRAALRCPTCGFELTGMPWHQAIQVGRCLACGVDELDVEPRDAECPRRARWGAFPI